MTERPTNWAAEHDGVSLSVRIRHEGTGELLDVRAVVSARGDEALERLLAGIRHASSLSALAPRGIDVAFRVEDIVAVEASVGHDERALAEEWLRRRLRPETPLRVDSGLGPAALSATFARRGALPSSQRKRYSREDGRIRVEAFELHVVEHCNLRCEHCCNMSPYLEAQTLSVAAIEAMCRSMAEHLAVDVFKIMGGEPLLHPDIAGVLRAIRRSRISETVRLFTNGILLHAMTDDFWRELDELTISNYTSAPVKPALLDAARAKARQFDVVLNVKPVAEFSEVMRATRESHDAEVRATFEGCWLRHRCLVVRAGKFFMCTRAAYAREFHRAILHDAHPADRDRALAGDGVSLDTPELGRAILEYLNRAEPLASCRFCYGGAGPVSTHTQLSKSDIREGRLHALRVLRS